MVKSIILTADGGCEEINRNFDIKNMTETLILTKFKGVFKNKGSGKCCQLHYFEYGNQKIYC
jgi:hypothetical protein